MNITNLSFGLFVLGSTLLALSYETTFAFDRPVHSAVCVFLFTGSVLLATNRFFPGAFRNPSSSHLYSSIPLVDHPELHTEPHAPAKRRRITRLKLPTTWIICAVAFCILCLRVELSRQISKDVECSRPSFAAAIPFFVSLYDLCRNKRWKPADRDIPPDESMNDLVYYKVTRNRLRYIIPTVFLMVGGLASASWREGWGSTYICPTVQGSTSQIPLVQGISVALDVVIIAIAGELSHKDNRTYDGKEKPLPVLLGFIYLGVAIFWILVGLLVILIDGEQRGWMFSLEPFFKRSVLLQALLFTFLTVTAIKSVSHVGVLTLSFVMTFIFVYVWMMSTLWVTRNPFPSLSTFHASFSVVTIFIGAALYLKTRTASVAEGRLFSRPCVWLRCVLFIWFCAAVTSLFLQHSKAFYHPIDLLIFNAKEKHQLWVAQAAGSPNLQHAVWEYQRRYRRHPPPGFDKWYDFATARSSVVIDDFDQIYEDLLPFQALDPGKLRQLTSQIASNPSNALAAVSVRGGIVHTQEDILPTHKWMVDGVAKMISSFSYFLPDMDIAVNLNDECRVAIPWEALEYLKSAGQPSIAPENVTSAINTWSFDRASTWPAVIKTEGGDSEDFDDRPFQRTFSRYGAPICPPGSDARNSLFWDRHSLCVSCAKPHTLGQFVSDWTLSGDICHQPDLGYLHGFFLSPSTFRVSQLPLPIFSQSKVQGFNDILYPSAWNYIDKVKYEPSETQPDLPYFDKESTLLWRGGTSEGVSTGGSWKGMTRQRLLHLVNNNTLNDVSVLLPSQEEPEMFKYYKLNGTEPHTKLNLQTDMHIGEKISRCHGDDCGIQEEELGLAERLDFQDHWKYRFLFDMDGAGFSGRFLPFLQSRSLPFRTGLFRQWFDSRLTAWRHFVPVDIRLHGFWSTLAYFAGVEVEQVVEGKEGEEGEEEGEEGEGERQTYFNAHDLEGTLIAEEGRMWAERVLRKEDMEIYFFRLLLEWGRLTDDQRDELGFTI